MATERVFTTPGLYSTQVNSIALSRQGNLVLALGHQITTNLDYTGSYRLLTLQLDTVWTLTKVPPGTGRAFLCALPSGEFVGGSLVGNQGPSFDKVSPSGRLRWNRPIAVVSQPALTGTVATADNGCIGVMLGAEPAGQVRRQGVLFRTDSAGQVVWERPYGWSLDELILHIQQNPATKRILMAGTIQPVGSTTGADKEYKLLLVNEQGDSIRGRRLAPLGTGVSVRTLAGYEKLLPLSDGGWLLTGVLDSATTTADPPLLVRLDSLLQPRWTALHRPPPGQTLRYADACELQDGSVLVLAWQIRPATNTFWLHRYSPAGQLQAVLPLPSPACPQVHPFRLTPTLGGRGLFVAGYCDQGPTDRRGYVARLDLLGLPAALVLRAAPARPAAPAAVLLDLYPNPATAEVRLHYQLPLGTPGAALHLFDATGRLVRRQALRGGSGEAAVPVAGLPPGLYAATLLAPDGRPLATRRLAVAAP